VNRIGLTVAWLRLYNRFRVEGGTQETPELLSTVQPITDMDRLLRTPEYKANELNLSGTAGDFVNYFTVPDGERWFVTSWWREASIADTRIVVRPPEGGSNEHRVSLAGTSEEIPQAGRLCLDQKWEIGMDASGDAGDTAIKLTVLIEREYSFPTPKGPGILE